MMMLSDHGVAEGKDQAESRPHNGPLTRSKWDSAGSVDSCNE